MSEQTTHMADSNVTKLWVVTGTLRDYAEFMQSLGATVVHRSQAIYQLGRFTICAAYFEYRDIQFRNLSPEHHIFVLGPNWADQECDGFSIRDYLNGRGFRFIQGKDLSNMAELES